jgi:putative copper export protein
MYQFVLYLHLTAAATWIGGSVLLFIFGITIRDREAQRVVYYHIGPIYGYFESVVLAILLISGSYMYIVDGFHDMPNRFSHELGYWMHIKIALVFVISLATIIHMKVSLKANGREKTTKEKILARSTSMLIFILNFVILYLAMNIRNLL